MPDLSAYLTFKAERIADLSARLADPATPPIPLRASCRVAGGSGVRPVRVRDFTVVTDSGAGLAGYDLGPTAPELLLSALASCIAHTFLIVAARRGVAYDSLEVTVEGQIDFRGVLEVDPTVPVAPQGLHYTATLTSPAADAELQLIQSEVERLCPVLRAVVEPQAVTGRVVRGAQ
jgi:uncharacterized OsmC-like protein